MPDPFKPPTDTPHPFFGALQGMPITLDNAQLNDISQKLDRLLDLLSPPKSLIITGDKVDRIIEQIQKKESP